MVQEPGTPCWLMFSLEFWVFLLVFSLGGHDTDTYRTVSVGGGAFELCLPSLGFYHRRTTLRSRVWACVDHMTKVVRIHSRADLEQYVLGTWRVGLYKIYNQ